MSINIIPIKFICPRSHVNDCPGCYENKSTLIIQVGIHKIELCSGCRYALAEKLLDICANCKHWRSWNVFRSHGRCHVNQSKVRYRSRKHHCKKFERKEEPQLVHL